MNFSTYRFTLDLQKHKSQMSIAVFQYDTAIKLSIGLTDGGVPYHLDGNITAKLYGKKPSGSAIVHDCSIEDSSRIIYTFDKTTANEIGVTNCQICIYNANDEQVTAPNFNLVVGEKAVNDDDVFEDEEFEGKYSALDAIFTAEAERVEAEERRVEAEEVIKNELLKKVDKTTEANKLYGTDEAGNPTTYDFDSMRGEKGEDGYTPQVGVDYFTETEKKELISEVEAQCKETLDNKLDKTTEALKLYGTDGKGNQINYTVSPNSEGNCIIQRLSNGHIAVPKNTYSDSLATSKYYVDTKDGEIKAQTEALTEKQTALEERVADLESLTLTYIEDGSTAYEKSVPAEVGKYALIKGIGGATEKVKGKNLINPTDILMPEVVDSYTINADGTITYTINNSPSGFAFISLSGLPAGKYYFYVEGTCLDVNGKENWNFLDMDYGLSIEMYVMSDFDNDLNEYLPTTRTLKVMLWRDESVTTDTWEVVEAPEGTVFEPYHEPYLRNAEVERIESIGANLIPFPYENGTKGAGYTETINGITWVVNADGSVTANGTATADSYFVIHSASDFEAGTYSVSGMSQGGISVQIKNGGGTSLRKPFTVTSADSTIGNIRLYFITGNVAKNAVFYPMFVKGSTPVDYKPYSAEPIATFVIPEGLNLNAVNDTYYDYIEVKDNKILRHKNIFEYSFTGYEVFPWTMAPNANGTYRFYIKNSDNVFPAFIDSVGICNQYTLNEIWDNRGAGNAGEFFVGNSGTIIFTVDDVSLTTGDNWRQHLRDLNTAGNPLTFRAALANPEVEDITHLFTTTEIKLLIERGGVLRFVNEKKMSVPSSVWFNKRKE